MKVIVLAAGFGTRLHPLTRDTAKPLLDVGGRPVLSWLCDRLLAVEGVDEAIVVTNTRFQGQFQVWLEGYGPPLPVRILDDGASRNDQRRGAIGDLALALESIRDEGADLLVAAGDNLVDFDLAPFAARFAALGRTLLLVREHEGRVPPGRYNEVTLGADGTVTGFREKPADPRSPLSALCLYFFPPSIRAALAEYTTQSENHDAPGYFVEWLAARTTLAAERITGEWHDIGDLQTLERARAAFAARREA